MYILLLAELHFTLRLEEQNLHKVKVPKVNGSLAIDFSGARISSTVICYSLNRNNCVYKAKGEMILCLQQFMEIGS